MVKYAMARRWADKLVRWAMKDLGGAEDVARRSRRLAARSPRLEHDHTTVLLRLAARQFNEGRPEDAVNTLDEAVQICRRRAVEEPAQFEPNLAAGLHMRSLPLERLGRYEEALADAEQSAELHRRLLPSNPGRFEPSYAAVLIQLGDCLAHCDRDDEALPVAEHAVRIERRLAADLPEAREPKLASSLITLSGLLVRLRRPEEGVPVAAEAVRIERRLVAGDAEAHEPDLARALHNLGACLGDSGNLMDGLSATDEAIAIYRRLAGANPEAHEASLGGALRNRDGCVAELTRRMAEQAAPGEVVLGPFPLCDQCKQTNGGLVAVRHRQVHIRANGRQACVDHGLADVMVKLWEVCETTSCCEDDGGRAYVVPAIGHVAAAELFLVGLGLDVTSERGVLYFPLIAS